MIDGDINCNHVWGHYVGSRSDFYIARCLRCNGYVDKDEWVRIRMRIVSLSDAEKNDIAGWGREFWRDQLKRLSHDRQ